MTSLPHRRTWPQRLIILVNVFGIVAAVSAAMALRTGEVVVTSVQRVQLAGALTPAESPVPEGGRAVNVLLVGYDSSEGLDPDDPVQIGRVGESNGDVLIVARIDEVRRSATLLSIPRDLWVPIATDGEPRKINAAFALGGAQAMVDTVEENLGIPIHHFASVDFAGFQGIVEVVDHVELFFDQPARDFNENPLSGPPRSMTGFEVLERGCAALDPVQSLAYVRSRNFQVQADDGTWAYVRNGNNDLSRIERQQQFLEALIRRAIDVGARNPFVLRDLVEEGVQHITIDQELTAQSLIDLGRTFESFEAEQLESYRLPTRFDWEEDRTGQRVSVVLEVPEASRPILELMRGADPASPATVEVRIDGVESRAEDAQTIADALDAAGFLVAAPTDRPDRAEGIVVRHSSRGAAAAQLVVDRLRADAPGLIASARAELDETLPGRTVMIDVGPSIATEPATTTSTIPSGTSSSSEGAPATTLPPPTLATPDLDERADAPVESEPLALAVADHDSCL